MTLPGIRAFANAVKDLEMRSLGLAQAPNPVTRWAHKREKRRKHKHTQRKVIGSQAELALMLPGALGSREETRKVVLKPATLPTL